jgi:hypothetical protein
MSTLQFSLAGDKLKPVDNINLYIFFGLFAGYMVVDGLYAMYTISVVKRRALLSANISFVMHFILALGVISYVENFIYVIPLAVGSWAGTFIATKYFDNNSMTTKRRES